MLVQLNSRELFDACNFDLHANELGPNVLPVLVEPVRVHQPRRILIRVRRDDIQKCRFIGHTRHSTATMKHAALR